MLRIIAFLAVLLPFGAFSQGYSSEIQTEAQFYEYLTEKGLYEKLEPVFRDLPESTRLKAMQQTYYKMTNGIPVGCSGITREQLEASDSSLSDEYIDAIIAECNSYNPTN